MSDRNTHAIRKQKGGEKPCSKHQVFISAESQGKDTNNSDVGGAGRSPAGCYPALSLNQPTLWNGVKTAASVC